MRKNIILLLKHLQCTGGVKTLINKWFKPFHTRIIIMRCIAGTFFLQGLANVWLQPLFNPCSHYKN